MGYIRVKFGALHGVCLHDFGLPTISLSVSPNSGSAAPHKGARGKAFAAMKEYAEMWQEVNKSLKAEFGCRNNVSNYG